ncbi:unnamed protein product [Phytomonas sp. EM1]|nr:unnamed protein product [Phytomonas sp. EM1]|eukprot:CCW64894.1 unnamed protein product [Phytomonas sp. isolate EM1]
MPPKRAATVNALRAAFPEELSLAAVERWAGETPEELKSLLEELRRAREGVSRRPYVNPAAAEDSPRELLSLFQRYGALAEGIFLAAERIRGVVELRIPELKEEDNLGVAVQNAVLRRLDAVQNYLLAGNGGEKEGVRPMAGMFVAKEYLAARAGIEEKILPKPAKPDGGEKGKEEGKEGEASSGTKAPSAILELQQLDYDALLKLELTIEHLLTLLLAFVNTYMLNWKKLIQPRSNTDTMVS